jgi:hypothetical protein
MRRRLDRRAWHRAVGTEHTAIARQRLKLLSAALADIKELAGVSRHLLGGLVPAPRASQRGFHLHQGDCVVLAGHARLRRTTAKITSPIEATNTGIST